MAVRKNAPRQQLAHLLQGVESVALEAAHDLHADQVVLLQHDGFTATDLLDTRAIERVIKAKTGNRLKIGTPDFFNVDLDSAYSGHRCPAALNTKSKRHFLQ